MPCFLVIQGILKALFSLIPWLLIFSDLPNYGSNSRKRYTIRILSKRRQRQAVESPKSWNSMGFICLKTTFLNLKHYLQIYLTLLSTDLWFGKWHEEYGKFFPEHSKLGFWWDPLIQTWRSMSLKSTGVICHDSEELCKIWRGTDLSFQSWHEEFDKFCPKHLKVSKIFILMGSSWAKYILFELTCTEELSFMKLKRAAKFGEESTCCLKTGIRNLTNFNLSTQKSQKFSI